MRTSRADLCLYVRLNSFLGRFPGAPDTVNDHASRIQDLEELLWGIRNRPDIFASGFETYGAFGPSKYYWDIGLGKFHLYYKRKPASIVAGVSLCFIRNETHLEFIRQLKEENFPQAFSELLKQIRQQYPTAEGVSSWGTRGNKHIYEQIYSGGLITIPWSSIMHNIS